MYACWVDLHHDPARVVIVGDCPSVGCHADPTTIPLLSILDAIVDDDRSLISHPARPW